MALDIFTGESVPALMVRAREALGPEACIVQVRRNGNTYELLATAAAAPAAPVIAPMPKAPPTEAPRFDQVLAAEMRIPAVATPAAPRFVSPAAPRSTATNPMLARPGSKMRPRVIALVGPTGAGKTTTIAKLASHPSVFGRKSVGLLGLDTYRVGGAEQLKAWGDLAGASVAIAHDEAGLRRSISRLIECDVVLVDTPGRGPRQAEDAATIAEWLRLLAPDEVHLVLPAGHMPQVTRRWIADYRQFQFSHIVASKLDECPDDVRLFDIASDAGFPMRWITNGQGVPGDLDAAADHITAALRRRAQRQRGAAA